MCTSIFSSCCCCCFGTIRVHLRFLVTVSINATISLPSVWHFNYIDSWWTGLNCIEAAAATITVSKLYSAIYDGNSLVCVVVARNDIKSFIPSFHPSRIPLYRLIWIWISISKNLNRKFRKKLGDLDNDSEEKEARCEKDEDFCLGFVTYCTFLNETNS